MTVTIMGQNYSPIRRTIKYNDIFMVTDENGNITSDNNSGFGIYSDDTRFLSQLILKINDTNPVVLSTSTETGYSSVIIGTNVPMNDNLDNEKIIQQETVQIKRETIIYGSCFETISIENYNFFPIGIKAELFLEADFLDIFEVRQISAVEKTQQQKPQFENNALKFNYYDSTGATLSTEITFNGLKPTSVSGGHIVFDMVIDPSTKKEFKFRINLKTTASLPEQNEADDFNDAFEKVGENTVIIEKNTTRFDSNNQDFNELVQRSVKDVNMLTTRAYYGEYLAAGIPWFTTLFGRDSIIAARQSLLYNPELARNILITLAKFQGKEVNDWRDEEYGKIPHEIRFGELARSNQIPHSPYYGTVDATSLWLVLLYEYYKWTDDKELLEKLWQNALDCLYWIDNCGIKNKYVTYTKRSTEGLDNQGWKDSSNSNIHQDGTLAESPIALIEVQSYTYDAKMKMAELAGYMGEYDLKIHLLQSCHKFKEQFNKDFWMKDLGFFTQGLDKNMNQMKIISSNAGHGLGTGLYETEYENLVAERLLKSDMFSGWGIRTLSTNCIAYNPMSYHNGSVWPHDNSLIVYGLSKIGRVDLSLKVTSGLFEAARLMKYKRLPELFCGFSRKYKRQDPPVRYPVACSPQAWAAASSFMLIQSMLNIIPNAQTSELIINNPTLPAWLDFLCLENVKVGDATVDLDFRKTSKGLVLDVLNKKGKLDVIIKK